MVRLFHLLKKGNQALFTIGKELISCLTSAKVRAFHWNYDRIYTELTFIKPLKCQSQQKLSAFVVCRIVFEASPTNSVDPDQTAPVGAV